MTSIALLSFACLDLHTHIHSDVDLLSVIMAMVIHTSVLVNHHWFT